MSKMIDDNLVDMVMRTHDATVAMIECDKALAAAGAIEDSDVRSYQAARKDAVAIIGAAVGIAVGLAS